MFPPNFFITLMAMTQAMTGLRPLGAKRYVKDEQEPMSRSDMVEAMEEERDNVR